LKIHCLFFFEEERQYSRFTAETVGYRYHHSTKNNKQTKPNPKQKNPISATTIQLQTTSNEKSLSKLSNNHDNEYIPLRKIVRLNFEISGNNSSTRRMCLDHAKNSVRIEELRKINEDSEKIVIFRLA
jgi:hypothetical protein